MTEVQVDLDRIDAIASRLDLRDPNRGALLAIVGELSVHYDVESKQGMFEAVVDAATGVGKTWIIAAAIEYLAGARGIRDFAIVTPGRTILEKTGANFTAGHRKSLLGSMDVRPLVVTSENFATAAMRAAMDDPSTVKLYVFTVQALIRPTSKAARKTHKFQEGLGEAFYEYLHQLRELVVFADEHHTYYGKAFSTAIRDLGPYALIGLTATPAKQTPDEQIIFRYPLAAAIADRYVKTPVIVGRKDDRVDPLTKLSDGIALLRVKEQVAAGYSADRGLPMVNPVMLVVAQKIEEAEEYGAILRSTEFEGGQWVDRVLGIHSDAPDEALAALDTVEDPDSPVRIIISVGMLKEGWDVKSVYVIASMRASVSSILTEQTLGRGLRLPWGQYTDIELLDTLEVLAHERYEELLRRAGVLNESFVDFQTRTLLRRNAQGELVVVRETAAVAATAVVEGDSADIDEATRDASPVITDLQTRTEAAHRAAARLKQELNPRDAMPRIEAPILRMTRVELAFSVADITNLEPFRVLGRRVAADPEGELRRMKVSARIVTGPDGMRRTELVTTTAVDRVAAAQTRLPLATLRERLEDAVLLSPVIPARKQERNALKPILDAFLDGMGDKAEDVLSAYEERATARLIAAVTEEQRRFSAQPQYDEVVQLVVIGGARVTDREVSKDRTGKFLKSIAYNGWKKSLYPLDWFDSEPERAVANIVDDASEVACWVRLHVGDLPILWRSDGREYNADLIVVEVDGTHWIVEVKRNIDITSDEVQGKRRAAQRWVNHVNSDDKIGVPWRYLLLSETDIEQATGSWPALKSLGS
ncbi:MAG: DEAD/DEAH box helicase family protein [Actinomycetota bacterium]|nr:DEAD/DEAH box helicase family protein [Actinomycetota bacterium]